jgi:hypothetical protein
LATLLIVNFAGRFLEWNGLYYSICSLLFMCALFEVTRWGVTFGRGERSELVVSVLTISVAWAGFVLGLLALWVLVSPTLDSPYARWWSYRSSHILGLYLWNATFAGFFALGILRTFHFAAIWVVKTAIKTLADGYHRTGYPGPYSGDAAQFETSEAQPSIASPSILGGRFHRAMFKLAAAALGTLLLYLLAPTLDVKYSNELPNHLGIIATFYAVVEGVGKLMRQGEGDVDNE